MSAPVFALSLRLWHPTQRAEGVISTLQLPIRFYHSVGDARRTPKGAPLEGTYEETYCCFRLEEKMRARLEQCISRWCKSLRQHHDFLGIFVQSGGKIEFYVSVFLEGDRGFELDN